VYDLTGDQRKGTMSEPRAVDPAAPDSYAAEWRRQADVRADALAGATELMLDMAGVSEGMRVLDLGAGLGDQSIAAARRVGPSGAVLATDRDPAMLEGAREAVAKAGLTNVQTRVLDAQAIDVEPGSFDAVIARMMLMLLPEPAKMLVGAHDALKPGGRLGATVFASAERNPFLAVPLDLVRRVGGLAAPDPREPGLFALGAPGAAEELLRAVGFGQVQSRTAVLPVRPPSVDAAMAFMREGVPVLRMLMGRLDEAQQQRAWDDIRQWLAARAGPEGLHLDGECLVVAGVR
jgi:SAM-dependent methyltransferase